MVRKTGMSDALGECEICEPTAEDESIAPSTGAVVRDRFSSEEIFSRVIAAAEDEILSRDRRLFFSAFAAGLAITLTVLLYTTVTHASGGAPLIGAILYPLGFIYIIIGNYQLYTENTLPPVTLVFERLISVPALLKNWGLVLTGNLAGGAVGAATLAFTGVLSSGAATTAASIALTGVATPWWDLFFKAVIAGFIVAGVVWLEYAARDTISRVVLVYLAFLAIPLGGLYHIVVSATEVLFLVFRGEVGLWVGATEFALPVLLGNTAGGVILVTVVNYFQVEQRDYHAHEHVRLSLREWLIGR